MNEIMSAWPLDRLIAVNPFWPHIHEPFEEVVTRRDPDRAAFIVNHVSETCAAYFDRGQASWRPRAPNLYAAWLARARNDLTPAITLGWRGFRAEARALPDDAAEMIARAEHELGKCAFLRGLRGWASYCAYAGSLEALTAVGAAWDLIAWRITRERPAHTPTTSRYDETRAWWKERDYQTQLMNGFAPARPSEAASMQVVFCIDVRSELMRRAIEAEFPGAQTLGFAGFFGLPIDHDGVPRLPGPLTAALRSTSGARADAPASLERLKRGPATAFSYVETLGGLDAIAMLKSTLGWPPASAPAPLPRLTTPLDTQARATWAEGILRGMSLTRNFAPVVLLLGHGASTTNNAHAHAYDCGACGGQPGDVNARLAARLLNDPDVRIALAGRDIVIPAGTRFVAGLHDTTTDEITLFDWADLDFTRATQRARHDRAALWGEQRDATARARDWSEPRPEWGLCNNAAFIAAPRSRTRHLDLGSRAFLHEYDPAQDPDHTVLEQILTAPVVVAHWINMQYFASTEFPDSLGAGNKVLHDVCAGGVGVLEGNGGDLRVGLPLQAVHDGARFRHQPLRLSVFVDAPPDVITAIVNKHPTLRQLRDNRWVHFLSIA